MTNLSPKGVGEADLELSPTPAVELDIQSMVNKDPKVQAHLGGQDFGSTLNNDIHSLEIKNVSQMLKSSKMGV
ncbi:hypothetical protein LIER_43623 [Lithospermum erythrorhizon]|uniref:Uncharacterized protein n=1 Tax=Lithospermum erythrorhizon TaxID=34254 RepID=A0AAV3QII3_LITER